MGPKCRQHAAPKHRLEAHPPREPASEVRRRSRFGSGCLSSVADDGARAIADFNEPDVAALSDGRCGVASLVSSCSHLKLAMRDKSRRAMNARRRRWRPPLNGGRRRPLTAPDRAKGAGQRWREAGLPGVVTLRALHQNARLPRALVTPRGRLHRARLDRREHIP